MTKLFTVCYLATSIPAIYASAMPFDHLFPVSAYQETVELCMQLLAEKNDVRTPDNQALFAGHILRICHLVNEVLDEKNKTQIKPAHLSYLIDLMSHVQKECHAIFSAFPIAHTIFAGIRAQLQSAETTAFIQVQ